MRMKWTATDERRARKMGWFIYNQWKPRIQAFLNGPFKSEREAVEWVCNKAAFGLHCDSEAKLRTLPKHKAESWRDAMTCRRAVYLCCLGGEQ